MNEISGDDARRWLSRWDAQQDRYIERREERFAIVGDAIAEIGPADPKILDLACGPGSFGTRLAERFPKARVVGVDFDPVVLGIARAAHADDSRRSWVEVDLRHSGWWRDLASGSFDAVVSTTALHWLGSDELTRVYREVLGLLRPGGVFANGDHVAPGSGDRVLTRLARASKDRVERDADARGSATWEGWWKEIAADPAFTELRQERERRFGATHGEEPITLAFHLAALRQAGFAEVGTVWQHWDDVVMMGIAPDASR